MNTITKSQKTRGFSEKASDYILVSICVIVLFIVAYPLYYVLIASEIHMTYMRVKHFCCQVNLHGMVIKLFLRIRAFC